MQKVLTVPILATVLGIILFVSVNSAIASTSLFHDNYSNDGWSQVGTHVTVNSLFFPNVVKFNNVQGGDSIDQERVIHKIPSPLPSNWFANFTYKFSSSTDPTFLIFALTASKDDPQDQLNSNVIFVEHAGPNQLLAGSFPLQAESSGITILPNTKYFVSLEKSPTLLTLRVYNDSTFTHQIAGSPVTLDITGTNYNNLSYLQHDGCRNCGDSHSLTAQIDNTRISVTGTGQKLKTSFYQAPVWTQLGSLVTVNGLDFPGIVKFNNVQGGSGIAQDRVVHQISSPLPSSWTANFDYKFTSSNLPAFIIFALSPTKADPQDQKNGNQITIEHGIDTNQLFVERYPGGFVSTGISISPNTKYFVSLEKTPALLTLKVFSDSARTHQIAGSPVTLDTNGTDFNNLNFIQHDGCRDCGSARTLTAQIDNMDISSP